MNDIRLTIKYRRKEIVTFEGSSRRYGFLHKLEDILRIHKLPLTPAGLEFTLYGYQKESILIPLEHEHIGLFLPVGAGKTVVSTLIALAWDTDYRIVVVPPVLVGQWVKWLNSLSTSRGAIAYEGTPLQRDAIDLMKGSWWVMSYNIFKSDRDILEGKLRGHTLTVLADEAQNLKNEESDNFKSVNHMSRGQRLIMMTGTELNSPRDAYGYIKLKNPSIYASRYQYDAVHVGDRDHFDVETEWLNIELMHKNLYLRSAHYTKEQVHAHLPKANYIPIKYDLDERHLSLYQELADKQLLELESGGKIDATTAGALYANLQQIIVNWAHFSEKPNDKAKILDIVDNTCDEINLGGRHASKLIIWTWYQRSTEAIRDHLVAKLGAKAVAVAYGKSNSVKEVARFMDDPNCLVLVAQPGSAGAGLNPQYLCWEMIFVEQPTRTIPFRQAAGRIDREGQRFNPNIRLALANGTIQHKLHRMLLTNDQLVSEVQGGVTDLRSAIYGF